MLRLFTFVVITSVIFSCKNSGNKSTKYSPLWQAITLNEPTSIDTNLKSFKVYLLDTARLKSMLNQAEKNGLESKSLTLEVPNKNGEIDNYYIASNSTVSTELLEKFPNLNTYKGAKIGHPEITIRFEWTSKGFSLMSFGDENVLIIQRHAKLLDHYIVYNKADLNLPNQFFENTRK